MSKTQEIKETLGKSPMKPYKYLDLYYCGKCQWNVHKGAENCPTCWQKIDWEE